MRNSNKSGTADTARIKDSLEEFFTTRKEILHEAFLEVIEDIGMLNAIKEGRRGKYVSRKRYLKHSNTGRKVAKYSSDKKFKENKGCELSHQD